MSNSIASRLLVSWLSAFMIAALALSASAAVNVSPVPLFLTTQAEPNVLLAIDDSGSMDWEIMMQTTNSSGQLISPSDGVLWWNTTSGKSGFTGWCLDDTYNCPGKINIDTGSPLGGGAWYGYIYLFPNGLDSGGYSVTPTAQRLYGDSPFYALAPIRQTAFARDWEFNQGYFNPAVVYAPWPNGGGTATFGNVTPSAAPYDPIYNTTLTMNLTNGVASIASNTTFRVEAGMVIPAGTLVYRDSSWSNPSPASLSVSLVNKVWTILASDATVNTAGNLAMGYFPATFCLKNTTALPTDTATTTFGYAGWIGTPSVGQDPTGGSTLKCYEIKPTNFNSTASYNAAIQNFANWFTYYRKRHEAARGGIVSALTGLSNTRVGMFTINHRPAQVTMNDLAVSSQRKTLVDSIYNIPPDAQGTPNRDAVFYAGQQYQRTDSAAPIQYACQANATLLLTDGYAASTDMSNYAGASGVKVGNADGTASAPYKDYVSGTLADVAKYFYDGSGTPLRSGTGFAAGKVPTQAACNATNHDPSLDCNPNLHMDLYGVTLGASGFLFNPSSATNAYTVNSGNGPSGDGVYPWWTDPAHPTSANTTAVYTNYNPKMVDDLWHAAINSHGSMLFANSPQSVTTQLTSALTSFVKGVGAASAVATNSTQLTSTSKIFQARFDTSDWSGQVIAYNLQSSGTLGTLAWDTHTNNFISSASTRNIITWNGSQGVSFTASNYSNLSAAQQSALGSNQAAATPLINWLRGDQSQEAPSGSYRPRSYILGDVIHSDPFYVSSEDLGDSSLPGTEGSSYSNFVATTKTTRTPMLYVGANDGMLHGLNANTGQEVFAFMPKSVFPTLSNLASPSYQHQYYVDGAPYVADAYLSGSWHSILVGSTGGLSGGSVFALDVTNPNSVTVLWEYAFAGSGAAVGQPLIARVADASHPWVAIFSNGYNSSDSTVKLLVVDLASGSLVNAIDTKSPVYNSSTGASNGIKEISVVDINNDGIQDYVYAGDLQGNMWKFDLTGSSGSWNIPFASGGNPAPLFVAKDSLGKIQPITDAPEVGTNSQGGYMIYFGTGEYFAVGDNTSSSSQTQTFYGIHDNGVVVSGRSVLQSQTILTQTPDRTVSANTVNYSTQYGWYLDLVPPSGVSAPVPTERVVSNPVLNDGRIIFTTVIPDSLTACSAGGSGYIMGLDAETGKAVAFFSGSSASGVSVSAVLSGTTILTGNNGDVLENSLSTGSVQSTSILPGSLGGVKGRQSWRQLQ